MLDHGCEFLNALSLQGEDEVNAFSATSERVL